VSGDGRFCLVGAFCQFGGGGGFANSVPTEFPTAGLRQDGQPAADLLLGWTGTIAPCFLGDELDDDGQSRIHS
jgi:hypothetical protein